MHTSEGHSWTAVSRIYAELFRLRKGGRIAVCTIVSHDVGADVAWELRLHMDTPDHVLTMEFCASLEDTVSTGGRWKSRMLESGWFAGASGRADRSKDLHLATRSERQPHGGRTRSRGLSLAYSAEASTSAHSNG